MGKLAFVRLLFVRINEKNFAILPGTRANPSSHGQKQLLVEWLIERNVLNLGREVGYMKKLEVAEEIIRFADTHPYLTFYDWFEFHGGEFSYAAQKALFFEQKKDGATLEEAIEEMRVRSLL